MSKKPDPTPPSPAPAEGFDALDLGHRHTLIALGQLAALIRRLAERGPDDEARALAAAVVRHFSVRNRAHHADEETHLFPALEAGGDPAIVQAVLRLRQDHHWLEEDWRELSPHLDAVACGQNWYDLDLMREAAEVFTALSHDHIALEESYIYPQARRRLDAGVQAGIGREMATRRRAQRP